MPRLAKFGLVAASVPTSFALGFILSRYLVDRDLREAEAVLEGSIATYDSARAEQVATLQDHYGRLEQMIARIEQRRATNHVRP
jgi:prefoldin subunit 5